MIKLIKKIIILIILVRNSLINFRKNRFQSNKKSNAHKSIQTRIYVKKYANEYNVDEYLIYAIIKAESNFEPNAESHRGAKGLMQLMYSTAEDISKRIGIELNGDNILEPDININLGTKYISMLIQKYNNINLALAAYNAGSGNVDGWIEKGTLKSDGSDIENVPFTETNNYVRKILRDYEIYKNMYEESN